MCICLLKLWTCLILTDSRSIRSFPLVRFMKGSNFTYPLALRQTYSNLKKHFWKSYIWKLKQQLDMLSFFINYHCSLENPLTKYCFGNDYDDVDSKSLFSSLGDNTELRRVRFLQTLNLLLSIRVIVHYAIFESRINNWVLSYFCKHQTIQLKKSNTAIGRTIQVH